MAQVTKRLISMFQTTDDAGHILTPPLFYIDLTYDDVTGAIATVLAVNAGTAADGDAVMSLTSPFPYGPITIPPGQQNSRNAPGGVNVTQNWSGVVDFKGNHATFDTRNLLA